MGSKTTSAGHFLELIKDKSRLVAEKSMSTLLPALLALAIGHYVGNTIQGWVNEAFLKNDKDKNTDGINNAGSSQLWTFMLKSAPYIFCMTIAVIVAAHYLNIPVTGIIGWIGLLSIMAGFMFQGLLQDVASGLLITINKVFKIGDVVKIEEMVGRVVHFDLLNTTLQDMSTQSIVSIRNQKMYDAVVTNVTGNRVHVTTIDALVPNTAIRTYEQFSKALSDLVQTIPQVSETNLKPNVGVKSVGEKNTTISVRVPFMAKDYSHAMINALGLQVRDAVTKMVYQSTK